MKYMFISDIHGNITKFDEAVEAFNKEEANMLIILGDTASHFHKNDSIYIANKLNKMKNSVEVIRGNCDTYDFENNLEFEMYDLDNLYINGRVITITHGHQYNYLDLPYNCGEIFIQGHTHVPMLQNYNGKIIANPGSVSRPRGTDFRCYILIDEKEISLKTLDGNLIKKIVL